MLENATLVHRDCEHAIAGPYAEGFYIASLMTNANHYHNICLFADYKDEMLRKNLNRNISYISKHSPLFYNYKTDIVVNEPCEHKNYNKYLNIIKIYYNHTITSVYKSKLSVQKKCLQKCANNKASWCYDLCVKNFKFFIMTGKVGSGPKKPLFRVEPKTITFII
jgi:hypothetical protein